mmetsp:Transcript_24572/g.72783  ORF Transcript_24572/g.72783 Transcript_24572/m.72783 type:complete len:282 (+) Transcript_24572:944-1789(+)|eukprot:350453-Chlamydomonas_euryale.AAC.2
MSGGCSMLVVGLPSTQHPAPSQPRSAPTAAASWGTAQSASEPPRLRHISPAAEKSAACGNRTYSTALFVSPPALPVVSGAADGGGVIGVISGAPLPPSPSLPLPAGIWHMNAFLRLQMASFATPACSGPSATYGHTRRGCINGGRGALAVTSPSTQHPTPPHAGSATTAAASTALLKSASAPPSSRQRSFASRNSSCCAYSTYVAAPTPLLPPVVTWQTNGRRSAHSANAAPLPSVNWHWRPTWRGWPTSGAGVRPLTQQPDAAAAAPVHAASTPARVADV